MKLLLIVALCAGLAAVILPLRSISQTIYLAEPQKTRDGGNLAVMFDPAFSKNDNALWFDGLQGKSPYRIRLLYHSDSAGMRNFQVQSVVIRNTAGKILMESPPKTAAGVDRDEKGEALLIVGYLNIPLDAEKADLEVTFATNGPSQTAHFELRRTTEWRIVHAGLEAIMGI